MKFYDELKAEMEAVQQQIVEAKKNERANASERGKASLAKSLALLLRC